MKARWDSQVISCSIYSIFSILTYPRCDLGHPMIVIMTGQLKNHDRPMFAIISGTTFDLAIWCFQSLQGELKTGPCPVYNRSRSRCPSYVTSMTRSRCTTWLCKDFNPDQAKISILTPQGFQSWLRKDFNPDFFKRRQDYFVRIHILNDYIKKKQPRSTST